MFDDLVPRPEPHEIDEAVAAGLDARPDGFAARIAEEVAALTELTAAGFEIDGGLQLAESTWIVYGHSGYGGEVVVGEYHDAGEAAAVLRAAPRPVGERPVP